MNCIEIKKGAKSLLWKNFKIKGVLKNNNNNKIYDILIIIESSNSGIKYNFDIASLEKIKSMRLITC